MAEPNRGPQNDDEIEMSDSLKSSLAMLVFGLFTLLFLVAIDHEEWFHLRPISVGAVAVSNASDQAGPRGVSAR